MTFGREEEDKEDYDDGGDDDDDSNDDIDDSNDLDDDGNDNDVDNDRRFMSDDATVPWVFSISVNSPKTKKRRAISCIVLYRMSRKRSN